jgi:glycosyltransferase involved in cell wall biosynthesis
MKLIIVVPCYNEEMVIIETNNQLQIVVNKLINENKVTAESSILYIDDGSKDNTWNLINSLRKDFDNVKGLKLSKNVGHQNALLAGLLTAKTNNDIIVSIDADLQDDVNVIFQMIEEYYKGNEIVYGARNSRNFDSFFKKHTAILFYKLMYFLGAETIYNHADYRLMSKKSLDELSNFNERNLFLRGMIPLLGFSSTTVFYDRQSRFAGESKYPFIKMMNFALNGITSMSVKPLRLIFLLGIIIFFITIGMFVYILSSYFTGNAIAGWSSLILSVWFLGSLILISIGVLGEYIGKIYNETKDRPRYIIEKYLD